MNITLINQPYQVIDTKEKITIADSFVVPQNKIGTGNGEAKLYVGSDNQETRIFFGNGQFSINCFLIKQDLLKYLDDTKPEYLHPEQPYIHSALLPDLFNQRKNMIEQLPDIIQFTASEQAQIGGPRIYINSADRAYKIIRELSLPNITYISIIKVLNGRGEIKYYFRLFADYFGEEEHPYVAEQEEEQIERDVENQVERQQIIKARIGQGQYRQKLLSECPYCPVTLVADDRLLIASHIKPWAACNNIEKVDSKNGFMFTPTIDKLFDKGFISFTADKRIVLSPFLSNMTYSKLGLTNNRLIDHLPIVGREEYLEYHRNNILKI